MATTRPPRIAPEPVVFQGPPDAMEAYLPLDPARRREVRASVDDGDGLVPVRVLTAPAGRQTLVRLLLPATTPAGDREALLRAGDEEFPAVLRAGEQAELDCTPATLDLTARDGRATATIHVVNTGNTVVELPEVTAFGLMTEGALEQAIGTGLMSDGDGVARLGRLTESLADGHGGLARVSIDSGAGPLRPGAATTVQAAIRLGDRPVPGRTYRGTWPLASLRIAVVLRIPATKGGRTPGGRAPASRRRATAATPTGKVRPADGRGTT